MRAAAISDLPRGHHLSGRQHAQTNAALHRSRGAVLFTDALHRYIALADGLNRRNSNRCISTYIAVNVCTSITFIRTAASRSRKRLSARASLNAGDANPSSQPAGISGLWSVIIPTYNRLPILTACLQALEEQWEGSPDYEVVVVDDGSTDGTLDFLNANRNRFPHVELVIQEHAGATAARNLGVSQSQGSTIVFIDSDMVVCPGFLSAHAGALQAARKQNGDDRSFTYGRVVNTANFDHPRSEPYKLGDYSAAFFATGNVAISRRRLLDAALLLPSNAEVGPFDKDFSDYGWEDLELGERLRQRGACLVRCPEAVGYHWHPPFQMDQLPKLIQQVQPHSDRQCGSPPQTHSGPLDDLQEKQRGRNGVHFFRKHPNMNVRLMVQLTPFHDLLWTGLTLGGRVNERTLKPLLELLVQRGQWQLAMGLLSPSLNWHTIQAAKDELRKSHSGP